VKGLFGIVSLLLALLVVGWLARTQLNAISKPAAAPAAAAGASAPMTAPGATLQQRSQEIQQQFKQSVDAALQPARSVPDDQ
jgi:hypothetical protein